MNDAFPSQKLVKALGPSNVAEAIGMTETEVKRMAGDKRRDGLLPASWFGPLSELDPNLDKAAFKWRAAK